jgi:hypothetical protein
VLLLSGQSVVTRSARVSGLDVEIVGDVRHGLEQGLGRMYRVGVYALVVDIDFTALKWGLPRTRPLCRFPDCISHYAIL